MPVFGAAVLKKTKVDDKMLLPKVYKTNMPPKGTILSYKQTKTQIYPNIRTAILDGLDPKLVIQYSNKQLAFYGKKKLIMPHKMWISIYRLWCRYMQQRFICNLSSR